MSGIDLQNKYSLTSANEVEQICCVLKKIGITYFNYIKIYNHDGSRELLTNNADWIEHFYKQAYYNNAATMDIEHLLPKGYFLWSELNETDAIYSDGKEYFNIDNGISFVVKRKDVTYLYVFASTRDNYKINNFYVRNIDLLKRFINYFNDRAYELKKKAAANRIYLPSSRLIQPDKINNLNLTENIRDDFLDETKVDRYYLLNISDEVYLTEKQKECAKYLVKGLSAKSIGNYLNISNRTVESYLLDIKEKVSNALNITLNRELLIDILRKENLT